MLQKWLRALSKGASALRFTADNWEWNTEAAKNELLQIAKILGEIEEGLKHMALIPTMTGVIQSIKDIDGYYKTEMIVQNVMDTSPYIPKDKQSLGTLVIRDIESKERFQLKEGDKITFLAFLRGDFWESEMIWKQK